MSILHVIAGILGAGAGYTANPVYFDKTNDWLSAGALTATDSGIILVSVWFYPDSADAGNNGTILSITSASGGTTARFYILKLANGTIQIFGRDASGTTTLLNVTTSTVFADDQWHHLLFSCDLADNAKRAFYGDGVLLSPTWSTYTAGSIDITNFTGIGAGDAGQNAHFNGGLAEVYLATPATWFNPAAGGNLAKFIAGGAPVDLGSDGSIPLGASSIVFCSGATASWHTNKGTGGGFTENGALTDGASPVMLGSGAGPLTGGVASPIAANWSSPATVIDYGSVGQWDHFFGGQPDVLGMLRRPTDNALVAYYLGAIDDSSAGTVGAVGPRGIGAAISTDNGATFPKYGGNPIIPYRGTFPDEGFWGFAPWVHTDGKIYAMVGELTHVVGTDHDVGGDILRCTCDSGDGVTFGTLTSVVTGASSTWWTGSTDNERSPLALWHDGTYWHFIYYTKKPGGHDIGHAWSSSWSGWTSGQTEKFLFGSDGPLTQTRLLQVIDRQIPGLLDYWIMARSTDLLDVNIGRGSFQVSDQVQVGGPPRLHLDLAPSNNAKQYTMPVYLDRVASKWFMFHHNATNGLGNDGPIQMRTQAAVAAEALNTAAAQDFVAGNTSRYYVSASNITIPTTHSILVRTKFDANAGSGVEYAFAHVGAPFTSLFRRQDSNSPPDSGAWVAQWEGSTSRLTEASPTTGGDGVNRSIVMQADAAGRELWVCPEGSVAVLTASNAVAAPTQAAGLLYIGQSSTAASWYEEWIGDYVVANRKLIAAEIEAIGRYGHSPLDVLGEEAIAYWWRLGGSLSSVPDEMGGPALTRNGTGWP